MVKINKKKSVIIIVLSLLTFIGIPLYVMQYNRINQTVPRVGFKRYKLNEWVEAGEDVIYDYKRKGYSFRVKSYEVLEYTDYLKKYNIGDIYNYMPEKVCDVELEIHNKDASPQKVGVNLGEFNIQRGSIRASIEDMLCYAANPQLKDTLQIAIRENTYYTLHLPFAMRKKIFSEKNWESADKLNYDFVVSLFPNKKVIEL